MPQTSERSIRSGTLEGDGVLIFEDLEHYTCDGSDAVSQFSVGDRYRTDQRVTTSGRRPTVSPIISDECSALNNYRVRSYINCK